MGYFAVNVNGKKGAVVVGIVQLKS